MSKLTTADILTGVLIAAALPLYYKVRFLLQGLIAWSDLLQPTLLVEYLFSALLGFGLVAFHRRFSEAGPIGFLLTAFASALAAVAFTTFFYTVVFPYNVQGDFLFDIALLAIFVPLLISGVGERVLLNRRTEQAEQAALRERYASLKSRMSPHFLFNSLSALADIIEEDSKLAVRFVEETALIYRYLIEHQYTTRVSLEKEIEAARALTFVMEARNPGALHVSMTLPDDVENFETAPLAVQSLIENALKHNRPTRDEPLKIFIRVDGDSLVVENTLVPAPLKPTPGTGLTDLAERIVYLTGKKISFGKSDDRFCVRIPLITADMP